MDRKGLSVTTVPNSPPGDDPAAVVERPYQDHFAQIYFRVIDDERIGKLGLAAYVGLGRFTDFSDGTCEVRRTKLAKTARLSVRGLDSGLEELVVAGYLEIQRIQNIDGSWAPSKYRLLDTALAQMAVSQGGGAQDALGGRAHRAPPPAPPARGVSHSMQGGSAHGATQERETFNERQGNEKPGELPLGGAQTPVSTERSFNRRAQELTKRYVDLVPLSKFPAIQSIVKRAMNARAADSSPLYDDDQIGEALVRLAQEGRTVTVETLRYELEGAPVRRRAAGQNSGPYFPGQGMFS